MRGPQNDRVIVVDAIAEGALPMVTLERSDAARVDIGSAEVFEHPDGLFTAWVTWMEYPAGIEEG